MKITLRFLALLACCFGAISGFKVSKVSFVQQSTRSEADDVSGPQNHPDTRLANIDYAGLGYDPILGNPHSELYDPGFRQPVIQLEYKTNATTSDGKWLVPDHVQVLEAIGCSYETDSDDVIGSTSYQQSLSVDASIEFGYANAVKFTASVGFKEVHEATTKYRRSFVSSVARCVVYKASINYDFEPLRVTAAFANAVGALPTERDDAAYIRFIKAYGTHFASTLYMGAKAVVRSEFASTNWTSLDEQGVNVKAAAQASFLVFTVGASAATERQRRLAETFDSNRMSYKASYLGSHPPSDGKWESWAGTTGNTPYPMQYVLAPLTELLNRRYFPNEDDKILTAKRALLNGTVEAYCGGVSGCGVPPPDRIPLKMNRVRSRFIESIYQTCSPGLSLLSCGIDTRGHEKDDPDLRRHSFPTSNTTCRCRDYAGATCSGWCTNQVEGFEVASHQYSGIFSVTCPKGKQLLGCHIKPATNKETYDMSWPTDAGNGCLCYDRYDATCVASCASNIRNHEVRSEFGKGLVTVRCSPGNYVLGCGLYAEMDGDVEKWRFYEVASVDSCECYDNGAGATCFAICGQFA